MVIPTTSHPCSTSRAAATDESTPPLMPTTIRSAIVGVRDPLVARDLGRGALVPCAEQVGQALELVRRRVADLDLTLSLVADDPDPRHQAALKRFLQRRQLDGPPASFARREAACLRKRLLRPDGILRRPDGPVMGQDLIAKSKLLGDSRQCEQRARVTHREPAASEVGLDFLRETQQSQTVRDRGAILSDPLR